jgi:SAM-dependent methyltransferase
MSEISDVRRPATAEEAAAVDREKTYWEQHEDLDWITDASKREVMALIPRIEGDALELCIGSGTFTRAVPATYRSYTGVDISATLLETLKAGLPSVIPVLGNAEELDFPPASFDAVLVFAGLHHLPRYQRSVAEAFEVLRPGGFIFCFEPNSRAWYRPAMKVMRRFIGLYSDDEVFLDPREVAAAMTSAGFASLQTFYLTPKFKRAHLSTLNKVLARMMYGAAAMGGGAGTQSFFAMLARKP